MLTKTTIAFANTNGGEIWIGVDDDGSVLGVEDAGATMLKVTNTARDSIKPDVTLFMLCEVREIDSINVVVVSIQQGTARPYYLAGKGIRPEGVFVRQGASTVPATAAAILKMIKETGGDNFETIRSLKQNLTFESAARFFVEKNLNFGAEHMRTPALSARMALLRILA